MKTIFRIVTAVAVLGVLSGLTVVSAADASAEMFQKLDVDADGFISMQEAEAHDALSDAFADGDDNGDGQLDATEFAKLEISDE